MQSSAKIFSGTGSQQLAEHICKRYGCQLGKVNIQKFSDGEICPIFLESVRGDYVFLVQSTYAPTDNLMELLLMIDAARRASADKVIAVMPYYGYARQDRKDKPRVAIGSKLVANMLEAAGADRVITMDLHVILNGSKMWISNAPHSQVAVVWAKDENGEVRGLILEKGMKGFTAPTTHGKWSLRASATGELVFDNVMVPKENILPEVKGLRGPLSCLTKARYGIAWGTVGAAMDCYDTALRYSKERIQFGKPIGAFQLQQKKLSEMVTEITKAQLLNWRLGVLMNENKATPAQVSMAKRNGCEIATNICRDARQILGGMGITGEYSIMRHMMNLESVITYEGTHDIHLLITGQDITGLNAFT